MTKKSFYKKLLITNAFMASLLTVVSCSTKKSLNWQGKEFYQEYNKLSYKDDDKNVQFIAPFYSKNNEKSSTIYQLLVYAFADGNNDGIGDFIGLKNNLNYFVDLGIDQLYLSPIHPASSYHGYDVINYTDVAPELGGKQAFIEFLQEAHSKGIKIYLDLVFNHTSFEHPWFLKALEGDEKYKNFYRFYENQIQDTNQDTDQLRNLFPNLKNKKGTNKWYTSKFWAGMPDLNLDNPEVIQELKYIQSYWTKLGVDGFRYDAFVEYFSSKNETKNNYNENKIFSELREASIQGLQSINRNLDIFMMGEWWDSPLSAKKYFYDGQKLALGTVYDGKHWKNNFFFLNFKHDQLKTFLNNLGSEKQHLWIPFLTNHDVDRWINSFRKAVEQEDDLSKNLSDRAKLAVKNAYFFLLSMPGNPIIYHGDELYMHSSQSKGDSFMREPFKWKNKDLQVNFKEEKSPNDHIHLNYSSDIDYVEDQVNNPSSTFNLIKFMNNFRKKHPFMYLQDSKTIADANEFVKNPDYRVLVRQNIEQTEQYLFIFSAGLGKKTNYKLKENVKAEIVYSENVELKNNEINLNEMGFAILKVTN
ncbi:alpha-amylase family glycosyl hydrolase [Mesomycoplasma lagogenitalium]|uniref:Alpha-amylase family glycosyl hydrolase n=1 Tax=Mesomycoplasma lagogenitalium TaxID=171286 RepID=A0ABY8LVF4_9BACT|nr:alpha-amylase family glycosyl hydrolase [Mesomycoplasma lagogenitalium]WGI36750.1 alpha-amylase family glycosyl hydrolase [Mesomycoplasma lagogenitalium]